MDIRKYLGEANATEGLQSIIIDSLDGFCKIYEIIKSEPFSYANTENSSGDVQLSHDLLADEVLHRIFDNNKFVSCYVSEEKDNEVCFVNYDNPMFKVAVDPLDGSSVVAHNVSVGTSMGIYKADQETPFINLTGRDMVCGMYAVYGPRLLVGIGLNGGNFALFRYDDKLGDFVLENDKFELNHTKKICSFGGLQKSLEIDGFTELITFWQKDKYKIRYTGSMATDLNAMIMRSGGVFVYPYHKLRKLYECNPFAFIVEQIGGVAVNLKGENILDLKVESVDDTSEIIVGSGGFVKDALAYLKEK